ncbi:hypothetical protein BaRGS_00018487, partial [Batillaria attramentaria]
MGQNSCAARKQGGKNKRAQTKPPVVKMAAALWKVPAQGTLTVLTFAVILVTSETSD